MFSRKASSHSLMYSMICTVLLVIVFHSGRVSAFVAGFAVHGRIIRTASSIAEPPWTSFAVVPVSKGPVVGSKRVGQPQMVLASFPETETAWRTSSPVGETEEKGVLDETSIVPVEQSRVLVPIQETLAKPLSLNLGRFLVLLAAAIYGTNFASVKMLGDVMPLQISAALRFSLGAAVTAAAVLASEKPATTKYLSEDMIEFSDSDESVDDETFKTVRITARELEVERAEATKAGFEVGMWYAGAYLLQAIGLMTVGASKSAFFNALAVIVVPLLDSLFRGKKMTRQSMLSVGLALAGVGLLELGPPGANAGVSVTSGDIFCLGQALFFGIGYWKLESVAERFPHQTARATVGQLAAVAVGSILFCGVFGDLPKMEQLVHWLTDGFIVKSLIWTGIFSTAFAVYLETVALRAVSASELTLLMTSVSLWGSGFAFVTMGERLSSTGLFGGLLILAGCVVSSFGTGGADGGGGGGGADGGSGGEMLSSEMLTNFLDNSPL